MTVRFTTKPFDPAPMTAGARITWMHTFESGTSARRTGVVWSLAPQISGQSTVWAIPDTRLVTDGYRALCVVRPRRRKGGAEPMPESADSWRSETGSMTLGAKRAAEAVRQAARARAFAADPSIPVVVAS